MAGIITFKCSVIKDGIEKFALKQPIFLVRGLLQSA
jgi:formamidase